MSSHDQQHDAQQHGGHQQGSAAGQRYQPDNTSIRAITIFIAILTGAVIVVMIVIRLLIAGFDAVREEAPPPAFETQAELPPPPRLQEKPAVDLEDLREREQRRLHEYGWIDREKGVVRLPIERAMELMVERETDRGEDEGKDNRKNNGKVDGNGRESGG